MFSGALFQTQLIEKDLQTPSKRRHRLRSHVQSKTLFQEVYGRLKRYLVLFLETSSIHGLNHMVAIGRHPCEILLWMTLVALSVFGAMYLSWTTWLRYQSSPTVVSMDRDMFAWNTTFPCVTICPNNKVDPKKLAVYINEHPEPDKEKLETFIRALANATYENFEVVPEYGGIPPEQYMDLLLNLSGTFKPILTIGASGISLHIIPTITEMGLCYGVNSKVAIYNSPAYRAANRWDIVNSNNNTFFVHPLDGEVFAQVINLSTAYDAYIHGPLEVPDIATKHQHSEEDYYMKLYVTALTVYTAPEAAKLSVAQRRCRFLHENVLRHNAVYTYTTCRMECRIRLCSHSHNTECCFRLSVAQRRCRFLHENVLRHNAVYTYTTCRMECRIRLCLKHCGCIPHFYRRIGDEKVCNVTGLHCLSKIRDMLYQLQTKVGTKTKKINCGCFPICDDVNYVIQSNVLQEWFLGTNLQWGIVTYPRMRYRRDIIFGFTDVLVAVGGMAGLFLGCSVLSFMEIVYFLSLRLICYAHASRKK